MPPVEWHALMRAKQHPVVSAVLEAFPDATITAVTPKKKEPDMALDFSPKSQSASSFSEAFQAHLDEAITKHNKDEHESYLAANPDAKRPAIGAGRIGRDCLRSLGYEFFRTPVDPGREVTGKLQRIFDRGHDAEDRMAEYLRQAGFDLLVKRADGKQFRFDVVRYENGKGRVKGMVDGILRAGPAYIGRVQMTYPAIWENKELGSKAFKKIIKDGLKSAKPEYFTQCQLNMAYLELHEHPLLITIKNADTQDIHAELVHFDAGFAQRESDKAVYVVKAQSPEELPRIAREETDFRCKWCDYRKRCWAESEPATGNLAVPEAFGSWLQQANKDV